MPSVITAPPSTVRPAPAATTKDRGPRPPKITSRAANSSAGSKPSRWTLFAPIHSPERVPGQRPAATLRGPRSEDRTNEGPSAGRDCNPLRKPVASGNLDRPDSARRIDVTNTIHDRRNQRQPAHARGASRGPGNLAPHRTRNQRIADRALDHRHRLTSRSEGRRVQRIAPQDVLADHRIRRRLRRQLDPLTSRNHLQQLNRHLARQSLVPLFDRKRFRSRQIDRMKRPSHAAALRHRSPRPQARISAAAMSSRCFQDRPPSALVASFELPAGSVSTRAPAIARPSSF